MGCGRLQTFQELQQLERSDVYCPSSAGGNGLKQPNEDKIKAAEIRSLNGTVRALNLQKMQEK